MNSTAQFKETVWDYYAKCARDLPWRTPEANGSYDPYKILVSEMMLQQTQVQRVIPKYREFLKKFPNIEALARAPLSDVIKCWQGLGYNRRVKYLHMASKQVMNDFEGNIPRDILELELLPGIGKNTAGAICAYAYNQPVSFIETNIRSVYIYYFFKNVEEVHDKDILLLVDKSIQLISCWEEQPEIRINSVPGALRNPDGVSQYREWYWALMDYGTYLKSHIGNTSRKSKTYSKQSRFEGSVRQIRGTILKMLSSGSQSYNQLHNKVNDDRLDNVLLDLENEGFIIKQKLLYQLV
ncbi:MAG: A/G-specific adenine glycosylase [Patescibacteria group bacterium]|nr:A/G-specific adenine glycosylase [Patescibacteria group bacterium]